MVVSVFDGKGDARDLSNAGQRSLRRLALCTVPTTHLFPHASAPSPRASSAVYHTT